MVVLLVVSEEEVGPSESARKEFPMGWRWGGEIAALARDFPRLGEGG